MKPKFLTDTYELTKVNYVEQLIFNTEVIIYHILPVYFNIFLSREGRVNIALFLNKDKFKPFKANSPNKSPSDLDPSRFFAQHWIDHFFADEIWRAFVILVDTRL